MTKRTPWRTDYPVQQDTAGSQQPTLVDSPPGTNTGDRLLASHLNTLRDKLQAVTLKVGDDGKLPAGSLLERVYLLELGQRPSSPVAAAVEVIVYVRTGGSDLLGTGTLTNPYATLAYAIRQIPLVIPRSTRFIIDITGCTETFSDTFAFPPFLGSTPYLYSGTPTLPSWVQGNPLTVQAIPTVIDTLASPSSAADPTSGHYSYTQTGKTWTSNEHVGRMVYSSGGNYAGVVVGNTADTIEVSCPYAMTGEISIAEPSATLTTTSSSYRSLYISSIGCPVFFRGIKFINPGVAGADVAIEIQYQGGYVGFQHCFVGGMYANAYGASLGLDACHFLTKSLTIDARSVMLRYSLLKGLAGTFMPRASYFFLMGSVLDGCKALGDMDMDGIVTTSTAWDLEKLDIRNGTGTGISLRSCTKALLYKVKLACAGNGVLVSGPMRADLQTVKGTVSGAYGLVAEDGAHIKVDANVTVSGGTNALKCGSRAATDWTTFRAGAKNEFDTGEAASDGSRIWQP